MSVETRDHQEFERYLEYQRAQRQHRIETLGGAATVLFLSTFDMGVTGARDPAPEVRVGRGEAESTHEADVTPLRVARERRLAGFATDSAELGYAHAA